MIRSSTLANGMSVVTEAVPGAQSIALSFWVGTGSRDESPTEYGISHFLEHLLFKGSRTRSALDIAQAIDVVGGDMNAFTTKECTAFYVRVMADDEDVAFDRQPGDEVEVLEHEPDPLAPPAVPQYTPNA